MRKMLLSFRPDVYEKIVSGEKIFEHRKVFPNEPIIAYLYVSRPRQVITGRMILTNKTSLKKWLLKYEDDLEAIERIKANLEKNKVVMEISEFQETTEIPLVNLKDDLEKFVIPQMYYFIDNSPLLDYIENNLIIKDIYFKNDFTSITSEMICIN